CFFLLPPPPLSTLFPYTTLFRSLMKPLTSARQICLLPPARAVRPSSAKSPMPLPAEGSPFSELDCQKPVSFSSAIPRTNRPSAARSVCSRPARLPTPPPSSSTSASASRPTEPIADTRSEEHTSELQ